MQERDTRLMLGLGELKKQVDLKEAEELRVALETVEMTLRKRGLLEGIFDPCESSVCTLIACFFKSSCSGAACETKGCSRNTGGGATCETNTCNKESCANFSGGTCSNDTCSTMASTVVSEMEIRKR